jgi:hypothetical protein
MRIDGIEKAAQVFKEDLNRVPSVLDREISKVFALNDQKFNEILRIIDDRDKRAEVVEQASKTAVSAALQATVQAIEVQRREVSLLPERIEKEVGHLRGMQEQRHEAVQRQIAERDEQIAIAAAAQRSAMDSAFNALKEQTVIQANAAAAAVTKSEAAFTKQLDNMLALLNNSQLSINEKVAAVNSRLDRNEGKDTGQGKNQATMLAVAAVLVSIVVGGFAISSSLRIGDRSGGGGGGGGYQPLPGPAGSLTVPLPTAPR